MKEFFQILEELDLERFNYPPKYELPLFKNEDIVLSRIQYAIEQGESILVYGDYDVDGLCCLLGWKDFFSYLGYSNVEYVRYSKRTHQIDSRALYQYVSGDYSLMIVCDAGSNSMADIIDLQLRGKDIVILDHHKSNYDYEDYPSTCYIVNSFSDDHIMSAGALVYVMVEKLARRLGVGEVPGAVLYAMLSMYADCVPMSSEFGRMLYYKSLEVNTVDYPNLITDFKFEYSKLSRRSLEFQVAPKINAIFRAEQFDILNDYIFDRSPQNIDILKTMITESWSKSREALATVADYIEVTQMKNFVIANLDIVMDDVSYIKPEVIHNYTGVLANMLGSKYGKTALVFCSANSDYYKISLRDFLGRDYLSAFKLFSEANGHPSAFGILLPKSKTNDFLYKVSMVDNGEYVEGVSNEPYVVTVDSPNVPQDFLDKVAMFNEFSGGKIPTILLRKRLMNRPDKTYGYGYQYTIGGMTVKSDHPLSAGVNLLLKPYIANKAVCTVEAQTLI